MKKYFKKIVLIFIAMSFTLICSCSKKIKVDEPKYTLEEFNKLIHEARELSEKDSDGFNLADYASGVNRLESKAYIFKRLSFFAVEFETTTQAKAEALRLNQYYSRNWLFDRVEGEPILEDYIIETFKATNPKRNVQRVPKTESKGPQEHSAQ